MSLLLAAVCTVGLALSVSPEQKIEKEQASQAREAAKLAESPSVENEESSGLVSMRVRPVGELLWIFVGAAFAVSAMILPGVSGSFILLLLGVYFHVLTAIGAREIVTLGVFAAGLGIGLLLIVRLMKVALAKAYNPTIAFMIGLMLGSLYSIWPFQRYESVGEVKVYLGPVLPGAGTEDLVLTIGTSVIGAVIIGIFIVLDRRVGGERSLV